MLLLLTGFMVMGFHRTSGIDPGFNPKNLYLISLDPMRDGYSGEQSAAFFCLQASNGLNLDCRAGFECWDRRRCDVGVAAVIAVYPRQSRRRLQASRPRPLIPLRWQHGE